MRSDYKPTESEKKRISAMLHEHANTCNYDIRQCAVDTREQCTPEFAAGILLDLIGIHTNDQEAVEWWRKMSFDEAEAMLLHECRNFL